MIHPKRWTRRQIVRGGAVTAAGLAVSRLARPAFGVLGANETIHVGVVGFHQQGNTHINALAGREGVKVTCLVDVDSRLFGSRIKKVEQQGGNTPKVLQDVRRALEDKDLDAITIATPNHWHSLITIWACQAGKDVYVEKPLSHNIHEGRIAVETARKYKRIVQHGTQNRSNPEWARVVEVIKSGKLGKLLVSRGLCYKRRESIGFKEPATPPAELDFNLWLGPVPEQPYHENLVHYNWHWFWPTGNGDIGNQGVHQMDVARWAIPGATLPRSVISLGGRFGYQDQGQTPNTQLTIFDYGQTCLIFEVRGLETGRIIGNTFELEAGSINGANRGPRFFPKGSSKSAPLPDVELKLNPGKDKFDNFLAAVRSRDYSQLNADVLQAHYSSALCHLANISYRLGQDVPFNKKTRAFGDNKEAYETLARMEEHLAKENGLKLDDMNYRLGRKLTVDAQSESIVGDPEAAAMLTRKYREPFVVPEKVV